MKSSAYIAVPRVIVTGSLPIGPISEPLTARGVTLKATSYLGLCGGEICQPQNLARLELWPEGQRQQWGLVQKQSGPKFGRVDVGHFLFLKLWFSVVGHGNMGGGGGGGG